MKLIYALLCDQAFLSLDRKVNIIGVFETINAPSFPVVHPKFTLVGSVEPSKDKFKMLVDIVDESNKSILNEAQEREVALPKDRGNTNFNFIIEIVNTSFPTSGKFQVRVLIDGEVVASLPLGLAITQNLAN